MSLFSYDLFSYDPNHKDGTNDQLCGLCNGRRGDHYKGMCIPGGRRAFSPTLRWLTNGGLNWTPAIERPVVGPPVALVPGAASPWDSKCPRCGKGTYIGAGTRPTEHEGGACGVSS
jgi:hypothetical protein